MSILFSYSPIIRHNRLPKVLFEIKLLQVDWLGTHLSQYFMMIPSIMKSTIGTYVTFYEFQVNNALMDLIKATRSTRSTMRPEDWSVQLKTHWVSLRRLNTSHFSSRLIVPEEISYATSSSEIKALIAVRMRTDEVANVAAAIPHFS